MIYAKESFPIGKLNAFLPLHTIREKVELSYFPCVYDIKNNKKEIEEIYFFRYIGI